MCMYMLVSILRVLIKVYKPFEVASENALFVVAYF